MPVTTNFQNWNIGKKQRAEIVQALEPVFADRPGKWHVQFICSGQDVEVRVSGPGVETSELLDAGADAQHIADALAGIVQF